jgi:DnaK suppressor protein
MTLDRQQLNQLRQMLDNRHDALTAEIQEGRAKAGMLAVEGPEGKREADERLADLQVADVADAELGRDWHELDEIQSALARIKNGEYGTCADCGRPIPFKRLMRSPASVRCIGCQDAFEHGSGHGHG